MPVYEEKKWFIGFQLCRSDTNILKQVFHSPYSGGLTGLKHSIFFGFLQCLPFRRKHFFACPKKYSKKDTLNQGIRGITFSFKLFPFARPETQKKLILFLMVLSHSLFLISYAGD
jgi:hypothetical protein